MAKPLTRADGPQSVPALLHRNASEFANAPAYREKEYGIWQSWTWSQTRDEVTVRAVRAIAHGAPAAEINCFSRTGSHRGRGAAHH